MQPARSVGMAGGGHFFGDGGGEGDDVVLHFALDFVDARDVEAGVRAQGVRGFGGDFAGFGQRFARGQLDFQPLREAVFVAEDAAHLGPRVSWNHENHESKSGPDKTGGFGCWLRLSINNASITCPASQSAGA